MGFIILKFLFSFLHNNVSLIKGYIEMRIILIGFIIVFTMTSIETDGKLFFIFF